MKRAFPFFAAVLCATAASCGHAAPVSVSPHNVTLDQALAMPSASASSSVTVIVSFYKRPEIVHRMLDALRQQTKQADETWAYVAGSPVQRDIVSNIASYADKHPAFDVSVFDIGRSLGYHGRFQIALQVQTDYVVVFDDDCIPGRLWLANAMHVAGVGVADGVFGIKGHWSRPLTPEEDSRAVAARRSEPFVDGLQGPLVKTRTLQEVDVVGGAWLMRSELVKVLFRRKPFTWATGEDIQLCSALRVVLNMSCYVLPAEYDVPDTMGVSPDYLAISERGDTTGTHVSWDVRFGQEAHLFTAGDPRWGWRNYFSKHDVFAVVTETTDDLRGLAATVAAVRPLLTRAGYRPLMVGVTLDSPFANVTSDSVGVDHLFRLAAAMDFEVSTPAHIASETLVRLSSALDMLQPLSVVSWRMTRVESVAGVGMASIVSRRCHILVADPSLQNHRLLHVATRVLRARRHDIVERLAASMIACTPVGRAGSSSASRVL